MKIPQPLVATMIAHAEEAYPHECCGLLAGANGVPSHVYRVQNVHETPRVFFEMAPKEQFWAFKNMRHNGQQLVAIYHSHPETPARPSQSDIRLAYDPDPFYLLVSLQHRDKPDLRAYRIIDGSVTEEAIEVV
ncbi:MAG TPA: M67 family metallopeptidase [Nitrospiria bacterium]|nr:M67 family metallopeptidase [Nitrospiria bacterium]